MTAAVVAPSFNSFTPGVEGAPFATAGALGRPVVGTAGLPLPVDEPNDQPREGLRFIRYANAKPATGQLVDVHVARMGSDGRVRVDGNPDPTAPLRKRCPVLSCLQLRTDYPGHLCLQPDGTEEWREWPAPASTAAPARRCTK